MIPIDTKRVAVNTVLKHNVSALHPLQTPDQYKGLLKSIKQNGQLEPVLFYRGKLVDGRHRLKAMKELGIEYIYYNELGNNLTIDQVKDKVLATEVRRHLTPTQLALKAYDLVLTGKYTQPNACIETQANVRQLQRAVAIAKLGRVDILNKLRDGKLIDVSDDTRYQKPTDSLGAVLKWLQKCNLRDSIQENKAELKSDTVKLTDESEVVPRDTTIPDGILTMMRGLSDEDKQYIQEQLLGESSSE